MPITTLAHGGIIPELGVAATRPAMVPEQKPTMVYLRLCLKSSKHQRMPDIAAAIPVFHPAKATRRFAPKAEPALKPRDKEEEWGKSWRVKRKVER